MIFYFVYQAVYLLIISNKCVKINNLCTTVNITNKTANHFSNILSITKIINKYFKIITVNNNSSFDDLALIIGTSS